MSTPFSNPLDADALTLLNLRYVQNAINRELPEGAPKLTEQETLRACVSAMKLLLRSSAPKHMIVYTAVQDALLKLAQPPRGQDMKSLRDQYHPAFDAFMTDTQAVHAAVDVATGQSWGGTPTVRLELFTDGTYRLLTTVGSAYRSPGILMSIPPLSEDELGEDDFEAFYDNAVEALKQNFEALFD